MPDGIQCHPNSGNSLRTGIQCHPAWINQPGDTSQTAHAPGV
ncbi:hypothetical protein LTSEMON_2016 [Salmonella enterica subsp. enterica serovar Montevideo str. S5-403]|uniref:Uncharacterized protein n=1 Tax=Salmonella enterica subsp. enterica serovar Montevideo str. S5-403 TaxID=913242 RepID=G5Q275_SALMO|nr:hypothetical protein LTSEMON_2016 [Salmonella enterica subsp. enterica serovar Montevideo str. S5-403]